jgi:two-component system KDP operon response regulator KdpE
MGNAAIFCLFLKRDFMTTVGSHMTLLGGSPTILIISDRPETGPLWVFSLQRKNWTVILESSLDNALERLQEQIPDLVLIDTQRPNEYILNLVRKLRVETVAPILMLVHAVSEDQVVEVYNAGIDECILKPIGPALIIAKARAWMRHTWTMATDAVENVRINDCVLVASARKLIIADRPSVKLTNLELRLLHLLMSRSPRVISHDEIIQRVWDYAAEADYSALKNVIYRLRQKIEVDPAQPRHLLTVAGAGYKFVAE